MLKRQPWKPDICEKTKTRFYPNILWLKYKHLNPDVWFNDAHYKCKTNSYVCYVCLQEFFWMKSKHLKGCLGIGTHLFSVMRRYRTRVSESVSQSVRLLNRLDWCHPGEWRYLMKTFLTKLLRLIEIQQAECAMPLAPTRHPITSRDSFNTRCRWKLRGDWAL